MTCDVVDAPKPGDLRGRGFQHPLARDVKRNGYLSGIGIGIARVVVGKRDKERRG
jgi:hypothetical protein